MHQRVKDPGNWRTVRTIVTLGALWWLEHVLSFLRALARPLRAAQTYGNLPEL